MKTIATLTALAFAAATGSTALAATDGQIAEIENFAGVDATNFSNAEVSTLLNVIHGGGSLSEKRALVNSLSDQY